MLPLHHAPTRQRGNTWILALPETKYHERASLAETKHRETIDLLGINLSAFLMNFPQ